MSEFELGMSYCTNCVLRDMMLQLIIEGGDGEQTATGRNLLTGEAVATWIIKEGPRNEQVLAQVRLR